jgi:RNA polymerase sigma-70 factor (ECF subfamily)
MTTVNTDALLVEAAWAQRLARRLVGDEADDLVQDGFVAALQARPASDRPLRPWLRRVLTNRAYNRTRTRRRSQAHAEAVASEAAAQAPTAEDLLARLEVQRTLAALVTALEEPYRQTLLLHFYEGLTSTQIEQLHGVPAGTVRWRLKQALDRLRQQLDQQHEGRRNDWRRMLVPLVPLPQARAPGRWRIAVAAAGLLAAGGLGTWLAIGTGTPFEPGGGPTGPGAAAGGEAARSSNAGNGTGGPLFAAAGANPFDGCQERLVQVRAEVARIEPEFVRVAMPDTLFKEGLPNPAAEQALAPPLARLMKTDDGQPVDHTLECRSWVCRMLLLERSGPNAWQVPLQRDPEMRERTRMRGFPAGRPTRDAASGAALRERTVWLKLAALDGRRLPGTTMGPVPARRWITPTTAEACQRELAAAQALVAAMRSTTLRGTRLDELFDRAAPDPALTRKFGALVTAAVAGTAGVREPRVECRAGRICRVAAETDPGVPADFWWRKVDGNPNIRPLIAAGMYSREVYFRLHAPGTAHGMELLKRLVADWEASSALAECARAHPATGLLEIRFSLPETGATNPHGDTAKISADVGGTLADSPLARCATVAAEQLVLNARLPDPVSGATLYRKVRFPLQPPQSRSTEIPK